MLIVRHLTRRLSRRSSIRSTEKQSNIWYTQRRNADESSQVEFPSRPTPRSGFGEVKSTAPYYVIMPRRSEIKAILNALLVDAASRILSSCQSRRFELACDIANHSAPTSANTANGIDGSIFIIA